MALSLGLNRIAAAARFSVSHTATAPPLLKCDSQAFMHEVCGSRLCAPDGAVPWVRGLCTHTDKYSPHGTAWSTRYYNEDDYAMYPDLTDRQRAILKPPSAHLWFPNGDPAGRPHEPYGRGRSRPDSRATTARI